MGCARRGRARTLEEVPLRKLRVSVLDLSTKGPIHSLWGRLMQPNFASIMPQAVAVWCEQAGHDVHFSCYTGRESLVDDIPGDTDLLFVAAYSQSAQLAYALSNLYRARGVRTAIGGSHARCYPDDAARYFDYVLGFTDKETILEVLRDHAPHRPVGLQLSAPRQPGWLPGVRERWKFIAPTLAKTPVVKLVPMLASIGCPYTCSFCIDATVDYQPLDGQQLREDLRFLLRQTHRPRVAWHDPNFGVRFDETMDLIESAVPRGSIDFAAESSLSLLSEPHLARLRRNGFQAILPGIESWYEMGGKSRTGGSSGRAKMEQVSDHLNTVMRYIPYVQANFVLGLDSDEGEEPFELTRAFIDRTPGVFPAYSLLSSFGRAAPLNLELQRAGRVLPTPFHFLDNNRAMNVRPRNYSWAAIYDHVIGVRRHSFSPRSIGRRLRANEGGLPRWLNAVRAVSTEGWGRIRYDTGVRQRLETDLPLRRFFEGETASLPDFYTSQVRRDLGPYWEALPDGALRHDPNAYLHSQQEPGPTQAAPAPRESPRGIGDFGLTAV